jgi:L-lactate dehydrogenase complex protein LldF
VEKGKMRYRNMELARDRASYLKSKVIANLADYLEEFEKNATKNGIEVIWARDGKEAVDNIFEILKNSQVKSVVKTKSIISEELELNENLEEKGIKPVETDLGEFIVQVAGEKPYHILTPAMHKSKEDVAKLFHEKFETPPESTPEELTRFVRKKLREKFISAGAGITGANFLVADTGSIALTENEGNGMMSVSFPKIHIVISGIEKIIPSVKDLPLFLPLLAAKGTGQQVTVYNSLLSGPRKENEENGPERMIVVLLDNKRSDIYKEKEVSQSLKCIRCGACLNACPVYKNIGGYTYNTTYSGPIGAVITPYLKGLKKYNHLSHASTICGACSEVCPVKIPLHYLLLLNRRKSVEKQYEHWTWNTGMKIWNKTFLKRKNVDVVNGKVKNRMVKLNSGILGPQKQLPNFANQSFSEIWKSKIK